jgi:arylsulfatase A-like enzyme
MSRELDFRSTITSLWFRLITLAIVGLVFYESLVLASGKARGWTFYLTTPEVIFEVAVRLVFAALAGMLLGTLCTLGVAPFLWCFKASLERIADWTTKTAVFLVVFLDSRIALTILIKSWWSNRGPRFTTALLTAHFVAFIAVLCITRARREVVSSLDGLLGEKMTRRAAIATVGGAAALVATEFALGKIAPAARAALVSPRPKSNILLITFDALSAEDMSLYGYRLPTTPNIDAFARQGTVFSNFYSASTFTTPCVASTLTGKYPSQNKAFQLQGKLHAKDGANCVPDAMRTAGFATGAFFSNPYAYYLAKEHENGFDFLPEPVFQEGGLQHLWAATRPLHQSSGFGSRIAEYTDLAGVWDSLASLPDSLYERYRAAASFEHALDLVAKLPDGFFLWVHVMTPHGPYLPAPADRGRFLPSNVQQVFEGEGKPNWKPHYEPDQQPLVDQWRLRYDEFIVTADRAFGAFMSDLENAGKLRDTTVIVSADHGESFEGGVFQHGSPYQTRPEIHIPLVIRTPGQQESRRIAFTVDQTALAPTILELAGQPKPDWMPGQSLAAWLNRDGQGEGEGLAFCQHLEKNSVFKPLHHGTVGVIDGQSQYQYVLDLDTQKGSLRPLNEAQIWDLDRSAENPALAGQLRAAIYTRFPDLEQKPT